MRADRTILNGDNLMLMLLGILFLMLKLAGVIYWAWWIVLIPFYPLIGGIIVMVCSAVFFAVLAVADAFNKRR